jgi:hypothetical protein
LISPFVFTSLLSALGGGGIICEEDGLEVGICYPLRTEEVRDYFDTDPLMENMDILLRLLPNLYHSRITRNLASLFSSSRLDSISTRPSIPFSKLNSPTHPALSDIPTFVHHLSFPFSSCLFCITSLYPACRVYIAFYQSLTNYPNVKTIDNGVLCFLTINPSLLISFTSRKRQVWPTSFPHIFISLKLALVFRSSMAAIIHHKPITNLASEDRSQPSMTEKAIVTK